MGATQLDRVAFSPKEFAALFGKSQTWGYRKIYSGAVKTITEYGRIQIPAAEVERILASADRYNGVKRKPVKSKKELEALKPDLQSAWQTFLQVRRKSGKTGGANWTTAVPSKTATGNAAARNAVLGRLTKGKAARGCGR